MLMVVFPVAYTALAVLLGVQGEDAGAVGFGLAAAALWSVWVAAARSWRPRARREERR
jgi:uncharacterized membrane protein